LTVARPQKEDTVTYDLFISYSRRDNETNRITELKQRIETDYLQFAGDPLKCFFDTEDIHGMDDWRHRILQGLRESQLLLLVLSPSYLASPYCTWEIVEYLKYEHSRAAAGQGVAPVYFVEVPGLDSPEFNQQAVEWVQRVRRRNHFDLRPWYHEGEAALKQQDVRARLEDLERALHQRVSKLRRISSAPGNLRSHNPHFVGRELEMQRLHESAGLGCFGVLSAVQGMGGLGKTALAVQYAYAYADFYPGGRWLVGCANQKTLAAAIQSLDVDLGITLDEAEKRDEERAAKRVLAELESRARQGAQARAGEQEPPQPKALLILDNVQSGEMLQPPQTDLVTGKPWLHVIVTTRMSGENFGHDPERQTMLVVDELPLDDAVLLIESYQPSGCFRDESERAAAHEIAEILGGFTLAVEVVAVFLAEKPDRTCVDFLHRLRKEGFDRIAQATKRSVNHKEKLISVTLQPTLDQLTEQESLVLSYAALLPPDTIPVPWLRALASEAHPEFGQDAEPGYDDPWLDLVNHLLGLRLFQPVDVDPDTQSPRLVRMHRLTAEVVRQRIGDEQALNGVLIRLADHALHRSEFLEKSWFKPECRWEIEPIVSFAESMVSSGHGRAPQLVKYVGQWYGHFGPSVRCDTLYRQAIRILQSQQPVDELEVAILCSNLACALHQQTQSEEAETWLRRALEIDRRLREPGHKFIAIRLDNLAGLLKAQGKLDEAEPMYREALQIRRAALPAGHPDIASSLIGLASLLQAQGKLAEAEPMHREAMQICRAALPAGHPEIADSLANLASLLYDQGKLAEAEPMYREALQIRRAALPAGHAHIGTSLSNLAVLLQAQGKLAEAEPMHREALQIRRAALPAGHPDIALDLNSHALLLRRLGRYSEAADMLREAIDIEDACLPQEHPKRPHRRNNLAMVHLLAGRLDEAASLNAEAWRLKATMAEGGHDMTSARILFVRIVLQWRSDQNTSLFLGQLRTLLEAPELPVYGNIARTWEPDDLLAHLKAQLTPEQVDLLAALVKAMNDHPAKVAELGEYELWRGVESVPLDQPWE
jgi:tetratricopeptide (TPR) repeat protein